MLESFADAPRYIQSLYPSAPKVSGQWTLPRSRLPLQRNRLLPLPVPHALRQHILAGLPASASCGKSDWKMPPDVPPYAAEKSPLHSLHLPLPAVLRLFDRPSASCRRQHDRQCENRSPCSPQLCLQPPLPYYCPDCSLPPGCEVSSKLYSLPHGLPCRLVSESQALSFAP